MPVFKNIFLTKHPFYERFTSPSKKKNKLLVAVAAMQSDFTIQKANRWVSIVEEIKKIKSPEEIHLRFHPREFDYVKEQFELLFQSNKIQTLTLDTLEHSIAKNFDDYIGVIGSTSNSLRYARVAASDIFVIGLHGAGPGGGWSLPVCMGDTTGICWLEEGETFTDATLDMPILGKNENPSVAEVLLEIVN